MVTLFPLVFDMAVFYQAYAFNGDLSKWQTNRVTDMLYTFQDARSFNHKTTLDIAWEANNPSVYPGNMMFDATCSSDPNCGKCSSKNTDGAAVTCSSNTQPAKPSSTVCIFCRDDGSECCTCPAGRHGSGITACIACEAGQSSIAGGPCNDCLAGTSSSAGTICLDCPDGTSSPKGSSSCNDCPSGRYLKDQAAADRLDCTVCPAGKYQTIAHLDICKFVHRTYTKFHMLNII